ncbi:MAG: acetoin utilization protein AcuC [Acetobacteraceae bacterium]
MVERGMPPDPRLRPLFVTSEIYRVAAFTPPHPLAIPRVSLAADLAEALGWLAPEVVLESPRASMAELARFHDPEYLAALREAERTQTLSAAEAERFRLGRDGNPIHPLMFRRPATSAGGVLLAARLTRDGGVVHAPGGGTHHGMRERASGFCYLNDAVLGLHAWLDGGLERLVYLDLDAHHGDGVEAAFAADGRVLTISVHEEGRWPFTGAATDRAGGAARNFPVPRGFNDSEFRHLLEAAILPLIEAFRPEGIMVQCGADGLAEDPMARLALSNNAHIEAIAAVRTRAPRLLVLGGGGYNPYAVARLWARIWGEINGFSVPARLPAAAETLLRAAPYPRAGGRALPEAWFTTLRDPPREGKVRPEIRRLAEMSLREIAA